ncbi:ribonuclease P [Paenibacillus swuensis]|uniref:Ribonuclease P protein component n=1 Tax=Paenibacillus swuensis TaxID=1178515 RepID=A0A172TGM2_9BACL|nr:ribonuclease P protein component [Paenibacillus swuensis]ANE46027.1 ribonuclease P [Paenibacillus swuensis]
MQKEMRLTRKEDFNKVYRYGTSFANHQLVVYMLPQKSVETVRVGISVSKKIGNAVIRNRMRRLIKEITRHHEEALKPHYDLVFIVRKPAVDMEYAQLEKSLLHVLRKASLLKPRGRTT